MHRFKALLFILGLALILRIPSLFEPYWYGDEGIYLAIGQSLRQGAQLYTQIHDNKPPLLYLIATLTGGSQVWFRFILLIWSLGSIAVFYKLAERWFSNLFHTQWATIFFVLLTVLPMLEGNVANAELFFVGLTVLAFYWCYTSQKIFWAGVVFGLAALFKMPALLEIAVWPLFWWVTREPSWFKKSFNLGLGAIIPLVVSIGYYFFQGSLNNYLIAAGLQNIPYLASWQAVAGVVGTLPGRAGVLAVVLLGILMASRRLSRNGLLLCLWWSFSLFAILLSGRPYPHYILQMSGVIALGIGMVWFNRWQDKIPAMASLGVLLVSLVTFHFYSYPSFSYYQNFLNWAGGKKSTQDYFGYFNPQVTNNYKIAKILNRGSMLKEKIFVWADEPMIYPLAHRLPVGRFTTRYHIKDFRAEIETLTALQVERPRYIVVISPLDQLPGLEVILAEHYLLTDTIDQALVYRRAEGIISKL